MKEYRKIYWPMILWALALMPVMLGSARLAERVGFDERGIIALMMVVVLIMLLLLMWMIWKGEHVYWFSGGPSFEEASAAGSEIRREYAWKHLAAMLKGSAVALILLAIGYFCGVHELLMIFSTGICIVAAAISTARIKWPKEEQHDSKN